MKTTIHIETIEAMRDLALQIASYSKPGFLICLEGDLGAGKTTFTQFLGEGLGVQGRINSPTFTIMKIYENDVNLYHIDAYRLVGEFSDSDVEEYLESDGVCVVEWYKNIESLLPSEYLSLSIEWTGDTSRKITIEGSGQYEQIVKALSH